MAIAVMVFPLPLSPARPVMAPGTIANDTRSTAVRWPRRVGSATDSSFTSSRLMLGPSDLHDLVAMATAGYEDRGVADARSARSRPDRAGGARVERIAQGVADEVEGKYHGE